MNKFGIARLVVLGIAVLGIGASRSSDNCGRVGSMRATQQALVTAIRMYEIDTGNCPAETQGLGVLVTNPGLQTWRGPYMELRDGKLPTDAWGHAFRYRLTNGVPCVDSPGPDGVFGTCDDNVNGLGTVRGGGCNPLFRFREED